MHKFLVLLIAPVLCLPAPQEGFGDASPQEIDQIRSGTFLEDLDDAPQYSFNYKVADEAEQTYIAMNEERAGETVTGEYSYVDPLGSLIVVRYNAGPMGYTETREVQKDFVTIRPRPVRVQTVNSVATAEAQRLEAQRLAALQAEAARLEAQRAEAARLNAQRAEAARLEAQRAEAARLEAQRAEAARLDAQRAEAARLEAQSAANSQADIVAQIVSQIQPLVSQTVTSAVNGGSRFSTRPAPVSQTVAFPNPTLSPLSAPSPTLGRALVPAPTSSSNEVSNLFGQGGTYNVRIATPEFNIEY